MMRAVVVVFAVAVLAGCGRRASEVTDAATLVPPGVTSYLEVRTALAPRAAALLARFPARVPGLPGAPRIPPGSGPVLDVATLTGGQVMYTQPADEKNFAKRLDATRRAHARIGGWIVFSTSPALLDAVEHRRGSLATTGWYRAAVATLPADAALEEIAPGWRATALTVQRHSAELEVHRLRLPRRQASTALARDVPADAVAAVGVSGPLSVPPAAPKLVHELASALGGPAVIWVRPDTSLPEVTIVTRPVDGTQAALAATSLLAGLTRDRLRSTVTVGGIRLTKIANGAIDFYIGLAGGRLVISDNPTAASRVGASSRTLPAVARLPDATESWAFADPPGALPLVRQFSGLLGATLAPGLEARLAQLRSVLVHTSHRGRLATSVTRIDLG